MLLVKICHSPCVRKIQFTRFCARVAINMYIGLEFGVLRVETTNIIKVVYSFC